MDNDASVRISLQAIKTYPASCIWRVSGELEHLTVHCGLSPRQKHLELPNWASLYRSITKLLTHPRNKISEQSTANLVEISKFVLKFFVYQNK